MPAPSVLRRLTRAPFALFMLALAPLGVAPLPAAPPYPPEPAFVPALADYARLEAFRATARAEAYRFTPADAEPLHAWARVLLAEGCIRPADLPFDLLWLRGPIEEAAAKLAAADPAGQTAARAAFAQLDHATTFWYADGTLGDTRAAAWSALGPWTHATATPTGIALLFPPVPPATEPYPLALDFFAEGVVRVRGQVGGHFGPAGLTPLRPALTETAEGLRLRAPWGEIALTRQPFGLTLRDLAGRTLWRSTATEFLAPPDAASAPVAFRLRSALPATEAIYGLGEQYASVNQRGRILNLWVVDAINSTFFQHWKEAYKPVPFHLSPSGYGLFVNSTTRGRYDLGATTPAEATLTFSGPAHDYYLFADPDPLRILQIYTRLTGLPTRPPDWALQPWAGGGTRRWRDGPDEASWFQNVRSTVERYAALDIPHSAIYIEGIPTHTREGAELIAWLRARGLRSLAWFGPATKDDAADGFTTAELREFLVKNPDGSPFVIPKDRFLGWSSYIDPTHPEIDRYMSQRFAWALRSGLAGAMLDGGEEISPSSLFADGRTGAELHNAYPYLYHRAYLDFFRNRVGDDFILFGRAGGAGSQQIAQFAGDLPVNFDGLAAAVRGLQSAAGSGLVFWGSDIGGYMHSHDQPLTAPLLVRWAQFAAFSPLMRQHGETPREPWLFGDEAVSGYRQAAWLRMNLQPFLLARALSAHATGRPLVAALPLAFPADASTRDTPAAAESYLFGDALLVAPVLNPEGARPVYFPLGTHWHALFAPGERHDGGTATTFQLSLDQPAVFLREDHFLPLQVPADLRLGVPFAPTTAETVFLLAPSGATAPLSLNLKNGSGLRFTPAATGWTLVGWGAGPTRTLCLLDVPPATVRRGEENLPTLTAADFAAGAEGVWYAPATRRLHLRLTTALDTPVQASFAP